VLEAFFWGALAASALLIGALVAFLSTPSPKLIAFVMALGAGLLIGSVSFELIDEALQTAEVGLVGLFTLLGAAAFTVGDWWLERGGGGNRKDSEGSQADGSPLAIVLGSVLDGIPESFVLGLTVLQGGVSVALLFGVLLSNFPEGMASSSGLRIAGWARARVFRMWLIVIAVSAVSAAIGYAVLDPTHGVPEPRLRRSPPGHCSRCSLTRCSPKRSRSRGSTPVPSSRSASRSRCSSPRSEDPERRGPVVSGADRGSLRESRSVSEARPCVVTTSHECERPRLAHV
jgi:ZIP family zinc transporter